MTDIVFDKNFTLEFPLINVTSECWYDKILHTESPQNDDFSLNEFGNLISFKGEYFQGIDEDILQWVGYSIFDSDVTLGHIIDFSDFSYSGGDKFLYFLHTLLQMELFTLETGSLEVDFLEKNYVAFTWPKKNTVAFSSLIEEECPDLITCFFHSKNAAASYLLSKKGGDLDS